MLREELGKTSMFEEVIGTSSALQMVLVRAAKVAPTDSTVLIMGETGTGKELIARAIHKRSKRSERPFISVNCAAVSLLADHVGVVWPRKRSIYWGSSEAAWSIRIGRGRHDFSRRSRRSANGDANRIAARFAGRRV